jgi:dimethylamine/trimethylamine dehydrogenase
MAVTNVTAEGAKLVCVSTGREKQLECDSVVLVTARLPNDALYGALIEREDEWTEAGLRSVTAIGDCHAPATIAAAVHAGRKYAENLDEPVGDIDSIPFKREITELIS